jgi:CheY-like chemotaxis protein
MRAASIVKDLLALARSREAERRVATSLNDIIGYVARTRRYALETRGIALDLELDSSLPRIHGDRAQLEQVLLNLVSNAEHALRNAVDAPGEIHGTRPRILIRTRRDDRTVTLEVEDNGPGLPMGDATHIWDPFWTTKEEGEGTGLGLALVHSIVTDHRGVVAAESLAEGGARFTIRMPAANLIPEDMPERAERPLDILVTVRDDDDLSFIVRFLTSRGHAVLSAADADRALHLAGELQLDAVICDADGSPLERAALAQRGRRLIEVRRPYDVEEMRRAVEDG